VPDAERLSPAFPASPFSLCRAGNPSALFGIDRSIASGGKIQVILAQIHQLVANPASLGFFQEGQTVGFSPIDLWNNMGWLARGVVFVLFIMSIWSLAVMIDRWLYFNAARKQSREFAPRVAGALKEGKLDEAVKVADRNKKSHLAEVVTAGLQEFRNYGGGGAVSVEQIESSKRALERAEAIVHAKLKRGLGSLATIGSTAPFVGLFGTVAGILKAFQEIATQKTPGIGAVAGGISEALVTTAFGLFVAIPAVWLFNYFTNRVEAFDVEMDNSSSELIDYFIKQSNRR
jgi:biopolymer transport protein ExbB/biopolymer transport protein TolQ